jgi:GNAT superfamily N-acetyltransferase
VIGTRIPALTLRAATREDLPAVLGFIRELAEYQRLADKVVASEALLGEHLFGPCPRAEVVLACWDGEAVGFALFFHTFSTFLARPGLYLEDLYVRPAVRGRGVGEVLMRWLARLACERGCGRFEWSVLDWNEPAIRFYRRLGAQAVDGCTLQRVDGDALVKLGMQA